MTLLTYTVPAAGSTLNSVADPQLSSALNAILTWAAGNIDASNLSGVFAPVNTTASSYTATPGTLVWATSGTGQTVLLPRAPTNGAWVGVIGANQSGANPVTVAAQGSDKIYTIGSANAPSILLGTPQSYALLVYTAATAQWLVVSGQQDTGWVTLTLATNWAAASGNYTPAYRLIGDRVWLRGAAVNNTGGSSSAPLATLPSQIRPASQVGITCATGNAAAFFLIGTSGGSNIFPSTGAGLYANFDGSSYSLI